MANKEYRPAALMDSRDVYIVLKRLAEYEDEAEQREQGCDWCKEPSCNICAGINLCNNGRDCESVYEPYNYCQECGRKLVDH